MSTRQLVGIFLIAVAVGTAVSCAAISLLPAENEKPMRLDRGEGPHADETWRDAK